MLSSTAAARGALSQAVARARYAGERTVISVRGRPAAAVVSLRDLEQLKALEQAENSEPECKG
jgi:prevent-host-death family protein